jgi:hypothetical protein
MFAVEPKKTHTKFTIQVAKSDAKRLARFKRELQALVKKHKVKPKRRSKPKPKRRKR